MAANNLRVWLYGRQSRGITQSSVASWASSLRLQARWPAVRRGLAWAMSSASFTGWACSLLMNWPQDASVRLLALHAQYVHRPKQIRPSEAVTVYYYATASCSPRVSKFVLFNLSGFLSILSRNTSTQLSYWHSDVFLFWWVSDLVFCCHYKLTSWNWIAEFLWNQGLEREEVNVAALYVNWMRRQNRGIIKIIRVWSFGAFN